MRERVCVHARECVWVCHIEQCTWTSHAVCSTLAAGLSSAAIVERVCARMWACLWVRMGARDVACIHTRARTPTHYTYIHIC